MTPKIKEYSFRSKFKTLGIEIVKLSHFFSVKSELERLEPHRIKFYSILFITEGEGQHQIDFKDYSYQKGSVVFIGRDQIHSWTENKGLKGYLIIFTEDFLQHNQVLFHDISYSYPYNSSLYKPIINLIKKDDFEHGDEEAYQVFFSLMSYLHQEFNLAQTPVKQEVLQYLLKTLLLKIQSQPDKEIKNIDHDSLGIFIKFQRLLDQKITETRNAADYCSYLKVSFRKLNSICKILTNKTIKAYIDSIIILKAKRYFTEQNLSISEISYLLGFNEVTNFTKFFKKHEALSPKAFKNIMINK